MTGTACEGGVSAVPGGGDEAVETYVSTNSAPERASVTAARHPRGLGWPRGCNGMRPDSALVAGMRRPPPSLRPGPVSPLPARPVTAPGPRSFFIG